MIPAARHAVAGLAAIERLVDRSPSFSRSSTATRGADRCAASDIGAIFIPIRPLATILATTAEIMSADPLRAASGETFADTAPARSAADAAVATRIESMTISRFRKRAESFRLPCE
jgi:hypothetical protein